MLFKPNVTRSTVFLFLSVWVIAFSICGFGTFTPAPLGLPHHASHAPNPTCEEECLARNVTHPEVAIGQTVGVQIQSEFQPSVHVAYTPQSVAETLSHMSDPSAHYPAFPKRYQLISNYRL
jgi:hypothetical protein